MRSGPTTPVGQNDDVVAARDRGFGALVQPGQRLAHPGRTLGDGVGEIERLGVETFLVMTDGSNLLEIGVGEDRLANFETLAARRALMIEQVRTRADEADEAHHEFLADRVDRRVRDLSEILLEVSVKQLRLV